MMDEMSPRTVWMLDPARESQTALPIHTDQRLNVQDEPSHPKLSSPIVHLITQRWWIEQGDALDVMRSLPNESLNGIWTEPPYGVHYQLGIPTDRRKSQAADKQPFIWWLHDAYRSIKDGGYLFIQCRTDIQEAWKQALSMAGFTIRSQIIWDRCESTSSGPDPVAFPIQHEVIWFASRGRPHLNPEHSSTVVRVPRVPASAMSHPNEKPAAVIGRVLHGILQPNDIICDPFAGSCSTGEAVLRLGGRFLGVEREQGYVQQGRDRLAMTTQIQERQHGTKDH